MGGIVLLNRGNGHQKTLPAPAQDPSRFSPEVVDVFGAYVGETNLNLGCAKNPQPGFVNLDFDPRATADVCHDLETVPLPFEAGTFDCVLGSHVFEHIRNFLPLVADLHRVLKVGGYLLAVTPYVSSDDAWDSPHHVRAFSENTWHYCCRELYENEKLPHAGYGAYQGFDYMPWQVKQISLVPYPHVQKAAAMEAQRGNFAAMDIWKRDRRNIIKELIAVLQKVQET